MLFRMPSEETIKKVAFKFISERDLMQALDQNDRRNDPVFCCHQAPGRDPGTEKGDC